MKKQIILFELENDLDEVSIISIIEILRSAGAENIEIDYKIDITELCNELKIARFLE